jgi:heme o synthase
MTQSSQATASVRSHALTSGRGCARFGAWAELLKVRLNSLSLFTVLVGYYLGNNGAINWPILMACLMGVALVAFAGATLNQWWERDQDAQMARTRDRPLPSGCIAPKTTLVAGVSMSVAGLLCLAGWVNWLTCALAAATLICYLFLYTPLKRVTPLCTWVGAVAGALPPMLGWTAAGRGLTGEGWVLGAIVYCWQLPHFLAIAWRYREDYARAGFVMLPVVDPRGRRSARWALFHSMGLLVASTGPAWLGLASGWYLAAVLVLGLLMLGFTFHFARRPEADRSRRLFNFSLVYLPLLLILLMLDKPLR